MKLLLVLTLLAAGAAANADQFSFFAAPDGSYRCSSYCSGFATSDTTPKHTVEYVNVLNAGSGNFKIVMSVDQITYSGLSADLQLPTLLTAANTPGITATINVSHYLTCTHSGRGQTCYNHWYTSSGVVNK